MIGATWGAVCRPKQGQTISGDTYLLHATADALLVAVIDGLGGGAEAAVASTGAASSIRAHPARPLQDIIQSAHHAIQGTRGAVIGLLRLTWATQQLAFIGVGNVGIHAYSRQPVKPISKGGILGYRLPPLLEQHHMFHPGDCFVLYTDGISSRLTLDRRLNVGLGPQSLADTVLQRYGKPTDDATVVVISITDTVE
jgi:phosphoserine phosphatase RsbX